MQIPAVVLAVCGICGCGVKIWHAQKESDSKCNLYEKGDTLRYATRKVKMEKPVEELDLTSIKKIVMKMIAGHLGRAVSELHPEDHLFDDLGADDLDQKEIIITIEEKFQIRLENEESKGMERISDIVDIIQKHFQKQKENESKAKI